MRLTVIIYILFVNYQLLWPSVLFVDTFVSPLLWRFNSLVSASYISVNIKADVVLNATQVITV